MKQKKHLSRLLALLLALVMLVSLLPAVAAAQTQAAAVYVAVDGNDANDGSAEKPVATLAKAAELARAKKTEGETVTVSVGAGKYFLSEALTLGAEDSSTNWIADGQVVLTGAKELGKLTWTAYSEGIYVADVEAGLGMDQLFLGGDQQILARYPNYNPNQTLQGSTSAGSIKSRSANWADPAGGYVRALHQNKWGGNSYKITGKADTNLGVSYTWVGDNNRGSGMHSSNVLVENIFEELDSAKEWYYNNETGKLYVMPGEGVDLNSVQVEAAVTEELIHIEGVQDGQQAENITFDGFTLENTKRTMFTGTYVPLMRSDWCVVRSGALFLQDAENVTFRNGTIRNIGGNAIFLSGHCDSIVIDNNEIENIGSSGVLVAGLPDSCREPSFWDYGSPLDPETDTDYVHKTTIEDKEPGPIAEHYPKNCTISNNHIKNVGIWEKQSSHVALSVAHKIAIVHNTMNVGPRAGINVGDGTFGGHEIAYNDVFDVQLETDDHGMFNSWGRDRFWSLNGFDTGGNRGAEKEPYSRIDCIDTITIHDNRMHFGGRVDGGSTYGIDLDDGSSNYDIYNNLCLNMGIKLREGFHRRVYNNILVNGQLNLHCTFEDSYDEIYGNIVIKGSPYALAATNESRFAASEDVIEKNWFYDLGMKVNLPGFWTSLGYENGSVLGAADPQFVNPEANDYTVGNAEVAASIGFVNFPMEQFGKPGCEDVCPVYVKTSPDSTVDVLEREAWLGATITALDAPIMTATGAGSMDGVYVEDVPADSLVYQYGLRSNDVIHTINGVKIVAKSEFVPQYNRQLMGDLVHLTIIRNQLPMEISFIKNESGLTMIDDQDSRITYVGGNWDYSSPNRNPANAVDCHNQTMTYRNVSGGKDGVYAELTFTGNRVVLYGRMEKNMGNYRITITDGSGKEVVNTTASAYIATGRPDNVAIYDSAEALTEGTYTIRVVPETGDYIIIDAFGIASAAESRRSLYVGPASVTASNGALVNVLEAGQELTISMPVTNTADTQLYADVHVLFYEGAGLRTAAYGSTDYLNVLPHYTVTSKTTVTVPEGGAAMRLAVLVTDTETGKPLSYPYEIDGSQVIGGEAVSVPTPADENVAVTYSAETGLATVARSGLAAGKQAVLSVNRTVWQTTVDENGVAAFVFAPTLTKPTELTFTVSAERADAKSAAVTIDPNASTVDRSSLLAAVELVEDLLNSADETKYTAESWNALKTACADAKSVAAEPKVSQETILKAMNDLYAVLDGLTVTKVVSHKATPSASAKGTWFQIYDQNGNVDGGNKDGGNGQWQARGNQVDTIYAGAWFEMSGHFASFRLLGANKNDSASFIVEITDSLTGRVTTEAVTATKNQGGTVTIYDKATLPGTLQTIRVYNNENGNYLELRGVEYTTMDLRDTKALQAAIDKAEVLDAEAYLSLAPVAEALNAAKAMLDNTDAGQADIDAAEAALYQAMDSLKQVVTAGGFYDPSKDAKGTWFRIFDKDGKPDNGNKDGNDGTWQARPSQVDTTFTGSWFEMTGKFTQFQVIGADKYDSANFIVKITNEVTGDVTTEYITATKSRNGDVVIYEAKNLNGQMVTIQVINNENGRYLEVRGIQCAVVDPNTVSVTGPADVTVGDKATYTVSVRETKALANATIVLTYEGLNAPEVEALNGFFVIGQTIEDGQVKVVLGSTAGLTTEDPQEILAVTMTAAEAGETASVTLTSAVLSGYVGDGEAFLPTAYGETTAATQVNYLIFDVNRDGKVNQLDLTRAQRWFGTDNATCDVNGDGTVNTADMILILNNYIA